MKAIELKEIREKNINELQQLLIEQANEQLKLRLEKGMGEAPKPQSFRNIRRNIARIHTIINEKERKA
jgi:large subunit ribosomal protein L29